MEITMHGVEVKSSWDRNEEVLIERECNSMTYSRSAVSAGKARRFVVLSYSSRGDDELFYLE